MVRAASALPRLWLRTSEHLTRLRGQSAGRSRRVRVVFGKFAEKGRPRGWRARFEGRGRVWAAGWCVHSEVGAAAEVRVALDDGCLPVSRSWAVRCLFVSGSC